MDFSALRQRWRICLTGEAASTCQTKLATQAITYWQTMKLESDRTCLWEDLPDPGHPYVRDRICLAACRRIEVMAQAWAAPGTLVPEELLTDILGALRFICRNWYNETERKGGEWWHREIGIPLSLNKSLVLLYEHMDEAEFAEYIRTLESYCGTPDMMCIEDIPEVSTGANRAWKCLALAECGILKGDSRLLALASDKIRDVFRYTEHGDGFYRDGSFVQHLKFAYTGGYGVSFLETIVTYMERTKNTPWALGKNERGMVLDWVANAYEPLIFRGGFMSMARGREIARKESGEHEIGHSVIRSMLKLAGTLESENALTLKRKIKSWIIADTYRNFLYHAPIDTWAYARKLLEDQTITTYDFPDCCKVYAAMDRVVHHRAGFAVGISMSSARTGRYESIHGENVRGWHCSDGMVYLYDSDLGQFSDDYFPTVNSCRLPGTTVDTLPREEIGVGFGKEPPLHKNWAGGVTLEGRYGGAGMDLEAEGSDLRAKKSWFLFDDEIVCLGAGIRCTQGRFIETVVENRIIDREITDILRVDGRIPEHNGLCEGVEYIHLKGRAPCSDIGYYFPKQQLLEVSAESRTDSWKSINHNSGSDKAVTNKFVNIVLYHGIDPVDARYEFVLLPGKTPEEVARYAAQPPIVVIANTDRVQAVRHQGLSILGMNCWTDEPCTVAGVTCHRKAALLLREENDRLFIAAADPTWKNEDGITIELNRSAASLIRRDEGVEVIRLHPTVKLKVGTAGAMGRSFEITLKLSGNEK